MITYEYMWFATTNQRQFFDIHRPDKGSATEKKGCWLKRPLEGQLSREPNVQRREVEGARKQQPLTPLKLPARWFAVAEPSLLELEAPWNCQLHSVFPLWSEALESSAVAQRATCLEDSEYQPRRQEGDSGSC